MSDLKNIKLLALDVDGTMTDAGMYIMEDGTQFKKFHARDGIGIKLAMKAGIEVGIISHSPVTSVVETRADILGIKLCYVGREPKENILQQWMDQLGCNATEVAFMGDDVNDLEVMKVAGLTACPADAVDAIKKVSDILLSKKGGKGCVREFIDEYLLKTS